MCICVSASVQKQKLQWLDNGRSGFNSLQISNSCVSFFFMCSLSNLIFFCFFHDGRQDLENPFSMPYPEQLGRRT